MNFSGKFENISSGSEDANVESRMPVNSEIEVETKERGTQFTKHSTEEGNLNFTESVRERDIMDCGISVTKNTNDAKETTNERDTGRVLEHLVTVLETLTEEFVEKDHQKHGESMMEGDYLATVEEISMETDVDEKEFKSRDDGMDSINTASEKETSSISKRDRKGYEMDFKESFKKSDVSRKKLNIKDYKTERGNLLDIRTRVKIEKENRNETGTETHPEYLTAPILERYNSKLSEQSTQEEQLESEEIIINKEVNWSKAGINKGNMNMNCTNTSSQEAASGKEVQENEQFTMFPEGVESSFSCLADVRNSHFHNLQSKAREKNDGNKNPLLITSETKGRKLECHPSQLKTRRLLKGVSATKSTASDINDMSSGRRVFETIPEAEERLESHSKVDVNLEFEENIPEFEDSSFTIGEIAEKAKTILGSLPIVLRELEESHSDEGLSDMEEISSKLHEFNQEIMQNFRSVRPCRYTEQSGTPLNKIHKFSGDYCTNNSTENQVPSQKVATPFYEFISNSSGIVYPGHSTKKCTLIREDVFSHSGTGGLVGKDDLLIADFHNSTKIRNSNTLGSSALSYYRNNHSEANNSRVDLFTEKEILGRNKFENRAKTQYGMGANLLKRKECYEKSDHTEVSSKPLKMRPPIVTIGSTCLKNSSGIVYPGHSTEKCTLIREDVSSHSGAGGLVEKDDLLIADFHDSPKIRNSNTLGSSALSFNRNNHSEANDSRGYLFTEKEILGRNKLENRAKTQYGMGSNVLKRKEYYEKSDHTEVSSKPLNMLPPIVSIGSTCPPNQNQPCKTSGAHNLKEIFESFISNDVQLISNGTIHRVQRNLEDDKVNYGSCVLHDPLPNGSEWSEFNNAHCDYINQTKSIQNLKLRKESEKHSSYYVNTTQRNVAPDRKEIHKSVLGKRSYSDSSSCDRLRSNTPTFSLPSIPAVIPHRNIPKSKAYAQSSQNFPDHDCADMSHFENCTAVCNIPQREASYSRYSNNNFEISRANMIQHDKLILLSGESEQTFSARRSDNLPPESYVRAPVEELKRNKTTGSNILLFSSRDENISISANVLEPNEKDPSSELPVELFMMKKHEQYSETSPNNENRRRLEVPTESRTHQNHRLPQYISPTITGTSVSQFGSLQTQYKSQDLYSSPKKLFLKRAEGSTLSRNSIHNSTGYMCSSAGNNTEKNYDSRNVDLIHSMNTNNLGSRLFRKLPPKTRSEKDESTFSLKRTFDIKARSHSDSNKSGGSGKNAEHSARISDAVSYANNPFIPKQLGESRTPCSRSSRYVHNSEYFPSNQSNFDKKVQKPSYNIYTEDKNREMPIVSAQLRNSSSMPQRNWLNQPPMILLTQEETEAYNNNPVKDSHFQGTLTRVTGHDPLIGPASPETEKFLPTDGTAIHIYPRQQESSGNASLTIFGTTPTRFAMHQHTAKLGNTGKSLIIFYPQSLKLSSIINVKNNEHVEAKAMGSKIEKNSGSVITNHGSPNTGEFEMTSRKCESEKTIPNPLLRTYNNTSSSGILSKTKPEDMHQGEIHDNDLENLSTSNEQDSSEQDEESEESGEE